jgi:hypothetical protein
MDADDMTTVADIPPFILLRKAFKVPQAARPIHQPLCSPQLQSMRDSGTLPPRGSRMQVRLARQRRGAATSGGSC